MEGRATDLLESNIRRLPNLIMMLLMGLPGSGKTTLCQTLPYALGDKYHVLHVCFDHVVQFREEWRHAECNRKWKSERAKLLLTVERLIKGLLCDKEVEYNRESYSYNFASEELESTSSEKLCRLDCITSQEIKSKAIFEKNAARSINFAEKVRDVNFLNLDDLNSRKVSSAQVSTFDDSGKFHAEDLPGNYSLITDISDQKINFICSDNLHDKTILLCVDDNFYYHSMRKEWWNLAAMYELAFCTLVVSCELRSCIERVEKRESLYSHPDAVKVPVDVIQRMSKNLELPNEKLNSWEKYWSVIDTADLKFSSSGTPWYECGKTKVFDENSVQKFEKISELIARSLLDPARPLAVEMNSGCFIATPSVIHEVDLALRKIVGICDKSLKAVVNKRRRDILENLKKGEILIPKELTDEGVLDKEILEKFVVTLIDLKEINL